MQQEIVVELMKRVVAYSVVEFVRQLDLLAHQNLMLLRDQM